MDLYYFISEDQVSKSKKVKASRLSPFLSIWRIKPGVFTSLILLESGSKDHQIK